MKLKNLYRSVALATTLSLLPYVCEDCSYNGKSASASETKQKTEMRIPETSMQSLEVTLEK